MLIACLTWINDANAERRMQKASSALDSLAPLHSSVVLVNNGGNSWGPTKAAEHGYRCVNLTRNYFDVAVHLSAYLLAVRYQERYFCYTYDDFILRDPRFVADTEHWLDANPDVLNMRVPDYILGSRRYDTAYTSKAVNAEAVRHTDGAGGHPLSFGQVEPRGTHQFARSNWRPNSRPMVWRTEAFLDYALFVEQCPVMQAFEKHLYGVADRSAASRPYRSSVLNYGAFSTFPQSTSDRMLEPDMCTTSFADTRRLKQEVEAWR